MKTIVVSFYYVGVKGGMQMKLAGRILTSVLVAGLVFMSSGCASHMSYKASQREIAEERIRFSGDEAAINALGKGIPAERAIKAVRIGEDGVGVGVDVSNMEALTRHPWRQAGAALLDGLLMYGVYRGADELSRSGKDNNDDNGNQGSESAKKGIEVVNEGNGNTVNIVSGDGNSGNNNGDNNNQ
jgi:hypothetical protein